MPQRASHYHYPTQLPVASGWLFTDDNLRDSFHANVLWRYSPREARVRGKETRQGMREGNDKKNYQAGHGFRANIAGCSVFQMKLLYFSSDYYGKEWRTNTCWLPSVSCLSLLTSAFLVLSSPTLPAVLSSLSQLPEKPEPPWVSGMCQAWWSHFVS